MQTLQPLTQAQFLHAKYRLLHPTPGGRIEAARKHGLDLTLLIEQLQLTPDERARKLESASTELETVRGIARL